jgi:Uncharacterized protein conserved in bacteria (DUF2184)
MDINGKFLSMRSKRQDPQLEVMLRSSSYLQDLQRLRMGKGIDGLQDAAATGQIFLRSELNKADTRLHMPLEGHTWWRDVPLMNGGGWVDTETAEFVDVFSPNIDGTGSAVNDIGVVNYNRSQDVFATFAWQRSIRIPLVESLRLAQANKSPNDILDKAVRTDWNKTLDRRVYQGFGAPGLLNQTIVTAEAAPNGATSGTPGWATKTGVDIVNDFQFAATTNWNASGNALDAIPNRFLVPASRYPYLLQPMVLNSTEGGTTQLAMNVLQYIKANYFGLTLNGIEPDILPLPFWAETAGAGGTARLTCYKFSDEFVNFGILQDIQRMGGPLSLQDGAFVATYVGNTGQVKVLRPTTMLYLDAI